MDKETYKYTLHILAGAAYNILSGGGGKRNFLDPPPWNFIQGIYVKINNWGL